VFSGTIIAVGVFILLSALWLALSFADHDSVVYSNLSWWIGGTAIFCMFLAGLVAGLSSGSRGLGAGSIGALTTWGLVAIVVALVVLPTFSIGNVPNFVNVSGHVYKVNYLTYSTAFWSLLIGMGAALVGGALPRQVDEPYLDVQRATVREAAPVLNQPTPVGNGFAPASQQQAPVVEHAPTNVATTNANNATAPVSDNSTFA
jgi:hypothetical protein